MPRAWTFLNAVAKNVCDKHKPGQRPALQVCTQHDDFCHMENEIFVGFSLFLPPGAVAEIVLSPLKTQMFFGWK